ncbi:MAG TPA: hypothetical protein VM053_06695 [Gemmatimonadaceae bacterium]|nr:hypothetical protein [Gemmatimonadaceae bacterium]
MKWTLECVRKGARDSVVLGTFESVEAAVVEAEEQSPRGIHWTPLHNTRIGVAGDRQYMIRQAQVPAVR